VWLGVNALAPPFDDARVRQAVGLSLDIDLLVQGAWNGAVPRAFAAVAPGLPGYWQDAPRVTRDIPRARALLQQAGHGDGLAAKLLVMNQPAHQRAGVIAQAMLRDAGIHVSLDIRDPGAFWSAGNGAAGRELQLVLQRFGGKPDPGFLLQWFTTSQVGGWNWQGFRDAEYDRLVIQAAASPDGPAREAIYQDAQRRMADSFCFVFLTHEVASCVYRDWLRPAVLRNGEDWLLDRFVRA
jgi:peptide/nickel transport system substrate-binding protein